MLLLAGALSGVLFGYVLQRGQLCFHATWAGVYERRLHLFRAWILAVAVLMVGLTVLLPLDGGLNRGLPFDPVHNIAGGLLIGVGMVVARSCASGLYFKLGAGMLGAAVGLAGWALGEAAVRDVTLPGSRIVLDAGDEATLAGVFDVPRAVVGLPVAVAIIAALLLRRDDTVPDRPWQWRWPVAGMALGGAGLASWALAGMAGHSFGASTVGAVSAVADGRTTDARWLIAFLVALVPGAWVAARTSGGLWVRGEAPSRYLGLAVGGALLGAGGRIGGGCNLGHGLSGVAQLNVSSWVVVATIIGGISLARAALRAVRRSAAIPGELPTAPTP